MVSSQNSRRRLLLLSVGLLLFWVCLATVLRNNLGSSARLFNDYADRADFFLRGSWLPTHTVPYRDVMSEYPQIPTFLFGILYLPFLNQPDLNAEFFYYSILFSFLMILLYIGLAVVLDSMLPGDRKGPVLALLLPAPLYFSYNRFDVLPALIVLLALLLVKEAKWEAAGILLGIGALTKWYPALLVMPVIMYMLAKKVSVIRIGVFLALFVVTCVAILAPTYFTGGLKAVLIPYTFHSARGVDLAALPSLLDVLTGRILSLPGDKAGEVLFLLLQLSALPVAAFANVDSFERLLGWCLLTVAVFMLFSRIYSPQWLLWIWPFMILLARDAMDTALIIAYGTVTYFEYPVLHVGFGLDPAVMVLLGWMNVVLLTWIIVRAVRRLKSLPREITTAAA